MAIPFFLYKTGGSAATTTAGVRSLFAFWMGGATFASATTTAGMRSLFAFWQGGAQGSEGTPTPTATASQGDPGGLAHAHFWARKARNRRLLVEAAHIASLAVKPIVLPLIAPLPAPIDRLALELDKLVGALRKDDEAAQRRQVQVDKIKQVAKATAQLLEQQQQLNRDNDAAAFILLLD